MTDVKPVKPAGNKRTDILREFFEPDSRPISTRELLDLKGKSGSEQALHDHIGDLVKGITDGTLTY